MKQKHYDVAAYIWPSYTVGEPRTRMFWQEGIGEWETVKKADAKFEGPNGRVARFTLLFL